MDPGIPVPPKLYGGHERLVYLFAEEYAKLGHQVTLLAGPNSHISGSVITFGVNEINRSKRQRFKEVLFAWKWLHNNSTGFDLIHNFGRLVYLLPLLNRPAKKIMTYGRPVSQRGIRLVNKLPNRNMIFTACSNYCVSTGNVAGRWETVYNAINFADYQLVEQVDDEAPLMFLGRLDQIKGAHVAIQVAKATGKRLLLAGNISDQEDGKAYFDSVIAPQIDQQQIIYLGPLNDEQKNLYLGQASALLFPISWDEPFGLVMIEANACGTPVIAFRRGSVPEVIEPGVNGIIVDNVDEMIIEVDNALKINRKSCRQRAEQRFDVKNIALDYLNL
ncbi:glycosyltransferase family 4 protein [Mucilaginibacter conchicola]|uniref:Glycosyltransferase family 4 protein n=2 Tax=Mucilaginibacter conchicola TaxID=2303333 RepID=A0A372P0G1_9SPHI|nr:glycosyltransferase family 4 protein [Mucilaginibacter conchicola]